VKLQFPSADPRLVELEDAVLVLNRFHWNVTIEHRDGDVVLRGGELVIARFSSLEELAVFTAGMSLALSLLPETAVDAIDQFAGGE